MGMQKVAKLQAKRAGFLAFIHLFSVNGTEFKIGRFMWLTLFYSIYYQERIIILYLST